MSIERSILPPITNQNYNKLGETILYGNYTAMGVVFRGHLLLSGGPSVRSSTSVIGPHEKWMITSVNGRGGALKYGDEVKLEMPDYKSLLLSGGPAGMRTNTTTLGVDETWQIEGLYSARRGQEVKYGDLVIFAMPKYKDILLSGGPDGVRTSVSKVNVDEAWVLVCPA